MLFKRRDNSEIEKKWSKHVRSNEIYDWHIRCCAVGRLAQCNVYTHLTSLIYTLVCAHKQNRSYLWWQKKMMELTIPYKWWSRSASLTLKLNFFSRSFVEFSRKITFNGSKWWWCTNIKSTCVELKWFSRSVRPIQPVRLEQMGEIIKMISADCHPLECQPYSLNN